MIRREGGSRVRDRILWVLPGVSAIAVLLVGYAVSHINVSPCLRQQAQLRDSVTCTYTF